MAMSDEEIIGMVLDAQQSLGEELSSHILTLKTILLSHGLTTEEEYEKLRMKAIAELSQVCSAKKAEKFQEWREDFPEANDFIDWLENRGDE